MGALAGAGKPEEELEAQCRAAILEAQVLSSESLTIFRRDLRELEPEALSEHATLGTFQRRLPSRKRAETYTLNPLTLHRPVQFLIGWPLMFPDP